MLGHQLIKRRPDIAIGLLTELLKYNSSEVKDLTLIPMYLQAFCDVRNIDTIKLKEEKYNQELTENKREFIGMVLRIYHPFLFEAKDTSGFVPRHGICRQIALTLNINDEGAAGSSNLIKQVVARLKSYHYKKHIENLYKEIIPINAAS